mmetsp:Transcript_26611/g.106616  ORF Transcript_26611/g.106616 Transcript_26611/m.106616 type:complete len:387 (-) Transcript_26611:139-1299(-)
MMLLRCVTATRPPTRTASCRRGVCVGRPRKSRATRRALVTRAAVCENLDDGRVVVRDDWHIDVALGPRAVHVRTKCAGLNFGELLQLRGRYQEKLDPPFVPGNELSGIVEAVGSQVTRVRPGDAVIALPRGGAWAADCVLDDERAVMPLGRGGAGPLGVDEEDFAGAASLAVAYGTAHMALTERAKVQAGETVLVTAAAGGVGLAAVELATLFGARVIAAASDESKLDLARSKGAVAGITYDTALDDKTAAAEFRSKLKIAAAPLGGVDVAVDMVGAPLLDPIVRELNFGSGRAVTVGFASGRGIPSVPANVLLVKNVAVLGLFWGAYAKHKPAVFERTGREVIELWRRGEIAPRVGLRVPLNDVNAAIEALQARKTTGKVVLTMD